jgi:hypothetical protein
MTDPAVRAYLRRFAITMTLYVVAVAAASVLSDLVEGPLLWATAVLPALPLLALFWIMGRYLAELTDEYLRMLEVRKALVATGLTLAVTTVLGFLEIYAGLAHMPLFFVPVIWFGGLCAGGIVNSIVEPRAP